MFKPILHRVRLWRLRNIARSKLAMMDDRMLADIGTERDALDEFIASRPE